VDDFLIIDTASDGLELLRKLESVKPDVIILDIRKPKMSRIDVARVIDEKMPWVKIISLATKNHPNYIKEMLRLGARGFLSKSCSVQELFDGIRSVYEGKTYFCSLCSKIVLRDFEQKPSEGIIDFRGITPREIEIITMLSEGFTTHEISDRINISEKTVERHKSNLLKKLHLRNTAHLVRIACENGLLIY
jgi:DNA-binding NarL/FixJ family response regulator